MTSIDEAWEWYQAARRSLIRIERVATKYWHVLPLEIDNRLRTDDGGEVAASANLARQPLDDLAVVVMFSVFESEVREHLFRRMTPEADRLTDPILRDAAGDALRGVEEGSFYRRVLAPLKDQGMIPADLVTQVDQVRDYRNWVAHGRRGSPTNQVDPATAYDRLALFISKLRPEPVAEGG